MELIIPGAELGLIDFEEVRVVPDRGKTPWRFATAVLTKPIYYLVVFLTRLAEYPEAPISDLCGLSEW